MSGTLSLFNVFFVPYSQTASGALLAYDYLCTRDLEVRYVWTGRLTLGKVLFLLNRYLPFIDTFMMIHLNVGNPSPETCLLHEKVATWFLVCGMILSEITLMLRTYAIWECRRSILIILSCTALLTCVPTLVITQLHLADLHYVVSPYPGLENCFSDSVGAIIIVAYILLVCSETVIVTLTMIKAVRRFRLVRAGWVFQLYRDGIIFYIYLLCLSLLSILLPFLASPSFLDLLVLPLRALHSILCTRVLFVIFRLRSADTSSHTASDNSVD